VVGNNNLVQKLSLTVIQIFLYTVNNYQESKKMITEKWQKTKQMDAHCYRQASGRSICLQL